MVLLHISVGISLHYKWEWLNLYFRGREFSGFSDIFFKKDVETWEKSLEKSFVITTTVYQSQEEFLKSHMVREQVLLK